MRDFSRHATERFTCSVDDIPVMLDISRLGTISFHQKTSQIGPNMWALTMITPHLEQAKKEREYYRIKFGLATDLSIR
jgi:hypothetical protein